MTKISRCGESSYGAHRVQYIILSYNFPESWKYFQNNKFTKSVKTMASPHQGKAL